jgi:hypothetical protein
MSIDPNAGGRITSFKLGNYEFLTGKDIHPDNYGSTFWPSPQTIWNWPPPSVLDNEPYQSVNNGKSIILTSGKDPVTGLQFIKEFSTGKNDWLEITYSMINISQDVKKAAPWEVTRAHKGGLLFFPAGETPLGKKSFDKAPAETINGIVWYKDEKTRPEKDLLTIDDGSEGWIAYAIDGRVFIKKFDDIKPAQFAPGEAEISFYISSAADYIEIEIQGEYKPIDPGKRSVWKVKWTAANVPSDIKIEKGNEQLVELVRGLIKKS